MDVRLRIVFREQVKTGRLGAGCRRRRKDGRISQAGIRYQRTVKRDSSHLDSVLRVGRAQHDAGSAAKEDSIAAADDGLLIDRITESKTRRKVVAVAHRSSRIETNGGQGGARVIHSWISQLLVVVTQTNVQRQLLIYPPVVL